MNQPHYLTVGQAAALSGVSVRTLRYYDQIGLLKPQQVGENGYRYYTQGKSADTAADFIFQRAGVSAQGNCAHPPPAGF